MEGKTNIRTNIEALSIDNTCSLEKISFLAFFILSRRTILLFLCKQQPAPRKKVPSPSIPSFLPNPFTFHRRRRSTKFHPGIREGWNKRREKDRLTACAPPRGKRMKNIFQSVPFCLTLLALWHSFSFLSTLSLSRGFLEEEIASKSTLLAHVPRITVFFSLVKGPLDGMDQVKWGVSRMRIFFSSFDRSDLVRLLNLFVHAV